MGLLSVMAPSAHPVDSVTSSSYTWSSNIPAQRFQITKMMDDVAHQFAALQAVKMLRHSKRLSLPSAVLVNEFEWLPCELK
jgi:hypothetical protein